MIKIITIGTIKEKYLKDAISDYSKRLTKYTKLEIIELKEIVTDDLNKNLQQEEILILKNIGPKDYVVLLDIKGTQLTSEELSEKINSAFIYNSNITFIIGSSNGVTDDIRKKADLRLSFSKMTFPHQLFRVMLLEQIYRSFKINNNESYHK